MWSSLVFGTLVLYEVSASVYDCWNPEKLARMNFPLSHQEANDPHLGKFSKVLKCLMREQTSDGGLQNMDWSQWQTMSGQFPKSWDNNQQHQPGWTRPGQFNTNNQQQLPGGHQWPQQPNMGPQPGQPQPGVHPNDYNNGRPPSPMNPPPNWPPRGPGGQGLPGQGMPPQGPPPQGLPPGQPPHQPPPGWNNPMLENENPEDEFDPNRKKNRRKNKNKNQAIAPSLPPEAGSLAPGSPMQEVQVPTWGTNVGAVNDEEAKTMSRNRQYGYAIMACAVVALAVLMVSAIFCCNSSNSTMSQPATQVSVQPPDTFSIYSYNKQPVIGSDTLRSGPLGDTLRTETLRSAASPQYRVSDIDPDFARRFREEHY